MLYVGACAIRLHLPDSHSLKDKRQVVKSVLAKVRDRFEIAAAEVDDLEVWQMATLGLACASNDAAHAEEILQHAARYIEESRPDVEVTDVRVEVRRAFD
ncbi:MAG TPA: DUF503 domain-containing protein [Ktedonobacterales bacterium]|jgi:hypothetical protein